MYIEGICSWGLSAQIERKRVKPRMSEERKKTLNCSGTDTDTNSNIHLL